VLRPSLNADDFLVAASPAMRAVIMAVERYADGDAPVLICGEHGTGRELVARVLHEVRKSCAWYARGLYGCNALRLRVWEAPDVAAARALVEDYFAQLIERQRRLGLGPEGERGDMDGAFAGGETSAETAAETTDEAA